MEGVNEAPSEGNDETDSEALIPKPEGKKDLTPRNRIFLELLTEGKSTQEAYRGAGYKGSDHAAYELRSYLKQELLDLLEGKGLSRSGLLLEFDKLNRMPLAQTHLDVKEKIDILAKMAKLLPAERSESKPKITAFIIKNASKETKVVEAHEVKEEKS